MLLAHLILAIACFFLYLFLVPHIGIPLAMVVAIVVFFLVVRVGNL